MNLVTRAGGFEMSNNALRLCLFIVVALISACDRGRERINVLTANGEPEVAVMDFSAPFPLDPLPAGWYHRTFWTRGPMQMAFATKDGVPSLRFETRLQPRRPVARRARLRSIRPMSTSPCAAGRPTASRGRHRFG
jgi:hypothetical protein